MSADEMKKIEEVDGFFDTVNRGKDTAGTEAAEKAYSEYMDAQRKKAEEMEPCRCDTTCNIPDYKTETRYHRRCRLRTFWRQVIDPAIGYIALGGVMVAGMVLNMVPAYIAIPAFCLSFIWVAIRADRFLRDL